MFERRTIMVETTQKMVEKTNELKKLMMAEMVKMDGLDDMSVEGFQALQLCNELVTLNNKLLVKNAEMMSEIDRKLDQLLKSKN